MSRFAAFGTSLLIVLATMAAADAGECERPAIEQLTHGSGPFLAANDHPSPSSDGRYVAFTNDNFGPALVSRLDTQTGMLDNLSGRGNLTASMSDSGARVTYDATFGMIGALDLIATFLYDYGVPPAERPRRIAGGEQASLAIAPAISGDGNRLAFFSFFTTNLGGGFGHFIQMLDLTTNQAPGVTQPYAARMAEALTPFASRYLSFNRDGSRLAFAAPSDLTGSNGDGNFEIYVYEHPGNVLLQTTRSSGGDIPLASGDTYPANFDPSVNASGTRIAFLSNRDYTGGNADGGFEVFLYDHDIERYFQITNTQGGDFVSGPPEARTLVQPAILAPAIDGSGNRIAFMSNYDFFGTNPDRNWEIYLWDGTGIPRALQVTFSTVNPNGRIGGPTNFHPALSADGTQVFFGSSANFGANVAGHEEIFRATLCGGGGVCGDGNVDDDEQCDDGELNDDEEPNACRTDCTAARCGDGVVDDGPPDNENCDDGNQIDGDDCPASCKLPIVLNPYLILGKGLCGDTPQDLEVLDANGNDITFDPDIELEFIEGIVGPAVLNAALSRVKNYLKDRFKIETPDLKTAKIEIFDGQVHFAQGEEGLGFNMVRAKRTINGVTEYSNRALVISGFRLITLDSLEIEPFSVANSFASVASDLITRATGKELPNPPMILFSEGPCDDRLSFIGRSGDVVVKAIKLAFLQGLISDVDLMAGVEQGIGLLPGKHPLAKLAKAIGRKAAPFIASQFLDFEVSSEAGGASEKEKGSPPVTMDNVIEVTDSLSRTAPFFKGIVTSRTPGISAVQATLDLGKCLGKATDDMMVLVGPRLEQQQIRNEQGRIEDPLRLGVNQERTASVVGLLNFLRDGEEPHEISFDLVNILPDRVGDIKKFIENWIPGGKKFVEGIAVPIDLVVPSGAMIGDSGLYEAGANYFRFKFTYNPFVPSITINESQLQTTIPNWPKVTTWTVPVPPNPPQPVVSVDESAGIVNGIRRGNGQLKVDLCLPFLTNDFSSDTNGVVVEGEDMLVTGIKFDDRNGNGRLDATEPGLPGWTIEVLSGIGNVIGSDVTGADGGYTVRVTPEQLPIGLNTFGIREQQRTGWTATAPPSGRYDGLPIALGFWVGRDFGNFQDVTVQGVKFNDANSNGARDGGEAGLGGWQIELTDSRGTVHRATTASDGSYSFRLPFAAVSGAGALSIREVQQDGWHATFPAGGALELFPAGLAPESGVELNVSFGNQLDSEGSTPTFTPTETVTQTPSPSPTPTDEEGEEATATPTEESEEGIIAGHKFEDVNGNGVRDNNEPGLGGWIIFLDDGNDTLDNPTSGDGVCDVFALEPCVVTTASGEYGFPADEEGTYDVREVQRPGWRQTTANPPTAVVTEVGQSFGDLDFGNQRTGAENTGDCNGDLMVAINELILGVNIALELQPVSACSAFDRNVDGQVTVDELLRAVGLALRGVPTPLPTASPTLQVAPTATHTAIATVTAIAPPSSSRIPIITRTPTWSPTAPSSPTVTSTATVPSSPSGTPTFSRTPTPSPTAPSSATVTSTATVTPSPTGTPTISRTPTPSPTAPSTPTATRTRTATRTVTEAPQSAPVITDINCDGFTGCLLALGEPFSIEFSYEDADGDAASWEMTAERDDGEVFELGGGSFQMPFAFGTTTVPFSAFTCGSGDCIATDWLFTVVVTDVAGNASVPASVAISVLGSGEG